METIFFYFFSALAIASAIFVIASRQPVYSVLYLVVTMFSLAALFALLGAHFLAIIQILVYAGAILVLFLFVIMMLDLGKEGPGMRQTLGLTVLGSLTGIGFFVQMAFIFKRSQAPSPLPLAQGTGGLGSIQAIGRSLFFEHLLAFELASLLLLAAILGVVVLSKKKWS